VATVIDMVVFVGLSAGLLLPLASSIDWRAASQSFDDFTFAVTDPAWSSHAAGILGVWVGLWWAYFIIGWGLCGATPGKWLLGLRVIDHRGRCPIGPTRAFLRLLAYISSSLTLCWGHFLVVLRRDRRALHDILAGTRVVRWQPPAKVASTD
jgi:uncharacterized RDD family membrane protein YckC